MKILPFEQLADVDNEVSEDHHPIILIIGRDIAELLINAGYSTVVSVQNFLTAEFSVEVNP